MLFYNTLSIIKKKKKNVVHRHKVRLLPKIERFFNFQISKKLGSITDMSLFVVIIEVLTTNYPVLVRDILKFLVSYLSPLTCHLPLQRPKARQN